MVETGIVVDENGYVCLFGNAGTNAIYVIAPCPQWQPSPTATPLVPAYCDASKVWGTSGNGIGQFNHPLGVAAFGNRLFVADNTSGQGGNILQFNLNGANLVYIKQIPGAGFEGLAVDGHGNLFAADNANGRVFVMNDSGSISATITGLNQPTNVWVDNQENLFVSAAGSVYKYKPNPSGGYQSSAAATLLKPAGGYLAGVAGMDSQGAILYVADWSNQQIYEYDETETDVYSAPKTVATNVSYPWDIDLDSGANAYVLNRTGGYQVFETGPTWQLVNTCTGFTYQGKNDGYIDPHGLALDGQGDIFITDNQNSRGVKFALKGLVLTHLPSPTSTPTWTSYTPGSGFYPSIVKNPCEDGTCTPTPVRAFLGVAAAPNVSKDGEPIRFLVNLEHPAKVHLTLVNVMGERIFQDKFTGGAGENEYSWDLENQSGTQVASGLYIYTLNIDDGKGVKTFKGKVAVVH
jgi:sugar lactone lactonase YvrE